MLSFKQEQIKESVFPYKIGKNYFTKHCRYVVNTSSGIYDLYHDDVDLNYDKLEIKKGKKMVTPTYITKGCSSMCESGFCKGHKMSRQDFIDNYCNGEIPLDLIWEDR